MWQLFLELFPEISYLSAVWILVILTLAIHVTFTLFWLFNIQFLFLRDKTLLLCSYIFLEVTPLRWLKYMFRVQIWNPHCPPDQNHHFFPGYAEIHRHWRHSAPQPWAGRKIPWTDSEKLFLPNIYLIKTEGQAFGYKFSFTSAGYNNPPLFIWSWMRLVESIFF